MLPWFAPIGVRFLQDFYMDINGKRNTFQPSIDMLNFGKILNEDYIRNELHLSSS